MHGRLAGGVKGRRHGGGGAVLVRHRKKFVGNILAPDPGGRTASEISTAIPQQPVLARLILAL
jgi:hypothetical protein